MTREERIARGEAAARILSEPLLVDAFSATETAAMEELLSLPPEADEMRRRLADRVNAIREVQIILRTAIELGRAAGKETATRP